MATLVENWWETDCALDMVDANDYFTEHFRIDVDDIPDYLEGVCKEETSSDNKVPSLPNMMLWSTERANGTYEEIENCAKHVLNSDFNSDESMVKLAQDIEKELLSFKKNFHTEYGVVDEFDKNDLLTLVPRARVPEDVYVFCPDDKIEFKKPIFSTCLIIFAFNIYHRFPDLNVIVSHLHEAFKRYCTVRLYLMDYTADCTRGELSCCPHLKYCGTTLDKHGNVKPIFENLLFKNGWFMPIEISDWVEMVSSVFYIESYDAQQMVAGNIIVMSLGSHPTWVNLRRNLEVHKTEGWLPDFTGGLQFNYKFSEDDKQVPEPNLEKVSKSKKFVHPELYETHYRRPIDFVTKNELILFFKNSTMPLISEKLDGVPCVLYLSQEGAYIGNFKYKEGKGKMGFYRLNKNDYNFKAAFWCEAVSNVPYYEVNSSSIISIVVYETIFIDHYTTSDAFSLRHEATLMHFNTSSINPKLLPSVKPWFMPGSIHSVGFRNIYDSPDGVVIINGAKNSITTSSYRVKGVLNDFGHYVPNTPRLDTTVICVNYDEKTKLFVYQARNSQETRSVKIKCVLTSDPIKPALPYDIMKVNQEYFILRKRWDRHYANYVEQVNMVTDQEGWATLSDVRNFFSIVGRKYNQYVLSSFNHNMEMIVNYLATQIRADGINLWAPQSIDFDDSAEFIFAYSCFQQALQYSRPTDGITLNEAENDLVTNIRKLKIGECYSVLLDRRFSTQSLVNLIGVVSIIEQTKYDFEWRNKHVTIIRI